MSKEPEQPMNQEPDEQYGPSPLKGLLSLLVLSSLASPLPTSDTGEAAATEPEVPTDE